MCYFFEKKRKSPVCGDRTHQGWTAVRQNEAYPPLACLVGRQRRSRLLKCYLLNCRLFMCAYLFQKEVWWRIGVLAMARHKSPFKLSDGIEAGWIDESGVKLCGADIGVSA